MRGWLIQVFMAELLRLDRAAMRVRDPDGSGPRVVGFDDDFREPAPVDTNEDGIGEPVRIELPAVRVPCQVEPEVLDELRMFGAGYSPRLQLRLVFHFRDLERLGLVAAAGGEPLLGPGDRLGALHTRDGALVQSFRTPPGLYLTDARASGFGLDLARPRRNLLLVTFEDRQQATGRAST